MEKRWGKHAEQCAGAPRGAFSANAAGQELAFIPFQCKLPQLQSIQKVEHRMSAESLLEIRGLSKSYSGVKVLNNVSLSVRRASVTGLIGENGAGKSTLIKCINGVTRPDGGEILFAGETLRRTTIESALRRGIVTIPQEFNLANEMTVRENIFLGHELKHGGVFLDHSAMRKRTAELLERLESRISPDAEVSNLSIAEKQIVEIARALNRACRLLIMDEPSTVLNPPEVENLFRIMRGMRDDGISIIYVSHKLNEVKTICDTVAVLRDGEFVCEKPVEELTAKDMASLMVGRELSRIFPPKPAPPAEDAPPALELDGVTLEKLVHHASLKLHRGEILGLAGLGGSGRTELAEAVYGIRKTVSGRILVNGREVRIKSPAQAVASGIAYLTEDRQSSGIIQSFPLAWNCSLISLRKYCLASFIRKKRENAAAEEYIRRFEIRTTSGATPIGELSGGNQQKGAIAKSLDHSPEIFIFDEPTRGIDIKSRSDIYSFIGELARRGMACLIISSDLEEVIGLCRKVAVMREGTVAGILEDEHVNEKEIMYLATGVK